MSNVEYSTSTQGKTITDTFTWTVPKFLDILNNESLRELRLKKPKNAAADWSGSRFHLKMQFLGSDNDTIEICYLSLTHLILKSEFIIRHRVFNSTRERVLDTKVNCINLGNQWQHLGALLKRDIVSNKDSFLMNDSEDTKMYGSLCLIIKFTIFQTKYDLYHNIYVDKSNVPETQLSHDFGQLLTSGLFSDVTIKSVEGTEFKVHKVLLASHSDVLKAHFEHNTTECQTNIIESHFKDEVLKEVLTFIYSNKAPRVDEIPDKLLAAADFYQLNTLKSLCGEALRQKLTMENVIETLELANLYSAENLIKFALEFIKQRQARQIIESEEWAKLNVEKFVKNMFKLYIMADDN